jgi:hypothetical protein
MTPNLSEQTRPFSYGLRSPVDLARMKQQIGIYPPPHLFRPDDLANPTICGFPDCYAGVGVNKPWHLSTAWLETSEATAGDEEP